MKETHGTHGIEAEYARGGPRKSADFLDISGASLGQNCPPSCPQQCPHSENTESVSFSEQLGEPLSIREVASLIGCSVWTVRQRYLHRGLPHVRSGPHGKLIFYRNQIIDWLLEEQQKGGTTL
jgi:hypothetical protein